MVDQQDSVVSIVLLYNDLFITRQKETIPFRLASSLS